MSLPRTLFVGIGASGPAWYRAALPATALGADWVGVRGTPPELRFVTGDTGFKVWATRYGRVGAGICWDQWYPETARVMMLQGADFLLYPTAIGSEPAEVETPNNHQMWQRAMVGHAVSNSSYVGSSNRVGREIVGGLEQTYYGHSFISDYTGELVAELGDHEEGPLLHELNLKEARKFRAGMGFFRDRRPELYGALLTLDGQTRRG